VDPRLPPSELSEPLIYLILNTVQVTLAGAFATRPPQICEDIHNMLI
jgi:hypothetical protein